MAYDLSEILKLPVDEQEAIANAIYRHLNSSNEEDKAVEEEIDRRFAKTKSGDYKGYMVDEIRKKMIAE